MTAVREIEIPYPLSQEDLRRKHSQVTKAYTSGLLAITGLSFLALGIEDAETLPRISQGLEFLSTLNRDLDRQEKLTMGHITEKGEPVFTTLDPPLYRPSEVLPKDPVDIHEEAAKVEQVVRKILDPRTARSTSEREISEAMMLLHKLSRGYGECMMMTAAEAQGNRIIRFAF